MGPEHIFKFIIDIHLHTLICWLSNLPNKQFIPKTLTHIVTFCVEHCQLTRIEKIFVFCLLIIGCFIPAAKCVIMMQNDPISDPNITVSGSTINRFTDGVGFLI